MGVTIIPKTPAAMSGMESLMDRPLPARGASSRVFPLLNDDTLHDMIDSALRAGPDVDVRPLVALSLDEFVNWSGDASWPEDVRERGAALVARFSDAAIGEHVERLVMPDAADAAMAQVAAVVGADVAADPDRFEARRGAAPGTHAVRDTRTGDIYRIEAVYGVVFGAAPEIRDRLEADLFPDGPAPRA